MTTEEQLHLILAELRGLRQDFQSLIKAVSDVEMEGPAPDQAASGFERYRSRVAARREEP